MLPVDDQLRNVLNRIQADVPQQGDFERFMSWIKDSELDYLRKSPVKEDWASRQYQGMSMALKDLQQSFDEAWGNR